MKTLKFVFLALMLLACKLKKTNTDAQVQGISAISKTSLAPQLCDEYVHMTKDGGFSLNGQAYHFESVNFRVDLTAKLVEEKEDVIVGDKKYQIFLSVGGTYSPDNNTACRDPKSWGPIKCCDSKESCRSDLLVEIQRLKTMGVNSIRLLTDTVDFSSDAGLSYRLGMIDGFDHATGKFKSVHLPFSNAKFQDIVFERFREAVQIFGRHDIRSLMLINGLSWVDGKNAVKKSEYLNWVTKLSEKLKNEPYLIGYDLFNEPAYNNPNGPVSKLDIKSYFTEISDAIRVNGANKNQLITMGNVRPEDGISSFDPFILPIDFNSPHLYAIPGAWPQSKPSIDSELHRISLGSCGIKCPYKGVFDGANCKLADGVLGTEAYIWEDGLYYKPRAQNNSCPVGWAESEGSCKADVVNKGRDEPFFMYQSVLTVDKKNGFCPAGATQDNGFCVVGEYAPPGAETFLWRTGFYYKYLSTTFPGSQEKCRAPAWDDGANCFLSEVPEAWTGHIRKRPLFYIKANDCTNGKKPYIIGETGFAVHEYDTAGNIKLEAHGTNQDQETFFKDFFDSAHACQAHGIQWWQFGDVHWGDPIQDHFGLVAAFNQVHLGKKPKHFDDVALRPAADLFARYLDFNKERLKCEAKEAYLTETYSGIEPGQQAKYTYSGTVFDQDDKPVPNALVGFWREKAGDEWRVFSSANADGFGKFTFKTSSKVVAVIGYYYGYETSPYVHPGNGLVETNINPKMTKIPESQYTRYAPPMERVTSCRPVVDLR